MSNAEHPLYAAINRKLAEIAATSPVPLPWHTAWQGLGPSSSAHDRLAVSRQVRDSGCLPPEAGFLLVAWIADFVADEHAENALRDVEGRLEDIRRKYGLDDDAPADDNAPLDYQAAMQQSHDAWDELYAATLEGLGEKDMAHLFRADREQFDREYQAGKDFFHGSRGLDDEWLDLLLDSVSACVQAESPMGPFRLRYEVDGRFWDIVVYPSAVEILGGRHDGEVVTPGFTVDLGQLQAAFDQVTDFGWSPLALNDPEGPYIWVEGRFHKKEVFVRLLAYAVEGEEPAIKLDTSGKWRYR